MCSYTFPADSIKSLEVHGHAPNDTEAPFSQPCLRQVGAFYYNANVPMNCALDLMTTLLLYYLSTILSNVISFYSLKELDKQKIKKQLSFTVLLHDKREKVKESRVDLGLKIREG